MKILRERWGQIPQWQPHFHSKIQKHFRLISTPSFQDKQANLSTNPIFSAMFQEILFFPYSVFVMHH